MRVSTLDQSRTAEVKAGAEQVPREARLALFLGSEDVRLASPWRPVVLARSQPHAGATGLRATIIPGSRAAWLDTCDSRLVVQTVQVQLSSRTWNKRLLGLGPGDVTEAGEALTKATQDRHTTDTRWTLISTGPSSGWS